VQGDGAVSSICKAIDFLNMPEWKVDVIIAGRGGGSFEDLLAFNDESVVRAYASSRVPIISAVGHEIDHPLTDLAADAFASTPSAAVQLAVPVLAELQKQINHLTDRLAMALNRRYSWGRQRLETVLFSRVYQNPLSLIEMKAQHLDQLTKDITANLSSSLINAKIKLSRFDRFEDIYKSLVTKKRNQYSLLEERLVNFSPLATLKRGYSVTRDKNGNVIRSYKNVNKGDSVEVILEDGKLYAEVISTEKDQLGR
jgi:exodeoxyribonuclease VII large subunit